MRTLSPASALLRSCRWLEAKSGFQKRVLESTYRTRSFLELVREVDAYVRVSFILGVALLNPKRSFPSRIHEPEAYKAATQHYYKFKIEGYSPAFGLLPKTIVKQFRWPECWEIAHDNRTLTLAHSSNVQERSRRFGETLELMVQSKVMPELRDEIIPTHGPEGEPVMHMDRVGSILFGTVMYGVQMLAYTNTKKGTLYWVPRRSRSVRAYAGMLDHCVGGALNSGETPMDTLVREAREEASLSESYVREYARSFGVVSYHMNHDANNEPGHQPQVMYTYSIELPQDMEPKASDGEVDKFELMTLERVKAALWRREFKANCVLTWISYLISQGIMNADNERDLHRITTHLHRRLDFPTR